MSKKKWTEEKIISEIRRVMKLLGRSDRLPSAREIRKYSTCYDSINRSGGLNHYSEILSLPTAGATMSIIFKKTCIICGKEFTTRYRPAKMCSQACRNRSYLLKDRAAIKADPERKEIRTMRDIRPSGAFEKERRARESGLHYADLQKERTLRSVGGVQI